MGFRWLEDLASEAVMLNQRTGDCAPGGVHRSNILRGKR